MIINLRDVKFSGAKRVLQFYLNEKHINYTKKSLNNLSANLNFLCDLKILSKMVPNGSNLMRFYITVKKNCGMYGKHRHSGTRGTE